MPIRWALAWPALQVCLCSFHSLACQARFIVPRRSMPPSPVGHCLPIALDFLQPVERRLRWPHPLLGRSPSRACRCGTLSSLLGWLALSRCRLKSSFSVFSPTRPGAAPAPSPVPSERFSSALRAAPAVLVCWPTESSRRPPLRKCSKKWPSAVSPAFSTCRPWSWPQGSTAPFLRSRLCLSVLSRGPGASSCRIWPI